jgi:hypothetical protein
MRRDTLDILHHRNGLLKNIRVDALKNDARLRPRVLQLDAVRVIDVTRSIGLGPKKFAGDLELADNRTNVAFLA